MSESKFLKMLIDKRLSSLNINRLVLAVVLLDLPVSTACQSCVAESLGGGVLSCVCMLTVEKQSIKVKTKKKSSNKMSLAF